MASFWDDFKDLFKTESQLKEERQKELAAALEAEKSITGQLCSPRALGWKRWTTPPRRTSKSRSACRRV